MSVINFSTETPRLSQAKRPENSKLETGNEFNDRQKATNYNDRSGTFLIAPLAELSQSHSAIIIKNIGSGSPSMTTTTSTTFLSSA